jgi:hypothetical protein
VAPDAGTAVDEGDANLSGVVDQGIGERHAGSAGPDHEVVDVQGARHG